MSFTDSYGDDGFSIDLGSTTDILGRFHRNLMDRREIDWEALDADAYDDEKVERARRKWAERSAAEYYSTSQFAQLLHRLCRVGAPVEMIGAATRLGTDECRHAELCARVADRLGGRDGFDIHSEQLSLYDDTDDKWLAIYRTILKVCGFGETISVPMLKAIHVAANDPVAEQVAEIIAADEGYHMNFGWEALEWMTPRLDDEQRAAVRESLPKLFGGFESFCARGPEVLREMAGEDLIVEEDDEPNLGTLTETQAAAIFYHCVEDEIIPRLEDLGYDAMAAWEERLVDESRSAEATGE